MMTDFVHQVNDKQIFAKLEKRQTSFFLISLHMDLPFSTAPIISAQSNPASFETWQHWLFPSSCTNSGCWCLEYIKSMLYFILMKIKPSKASTTPSSSASLYTHAHWSYKHHFSPLALHAGQLAHSNIQLYWNLPT